MPRLLVVPPGLAAPETTAHAAPPDADAAVRADAVGRHACRYHGVLHRLLVLLVVVELTLHTHALLHKLGNLANTRIVLEIERRPVSVSDPTVAIAPATEEEGRGLLSVVEEAAPLGRRC